MSAKRTEGRMGGGAPGLRGLTGLTLGRVAGVEVGLDWSLLIVFGLIAMALAGGMLPRWHPDWGQAQVLVTALAAALLFLVSVLAHELAHAVVGRRYGVEIRRITLFVFGGMAHLEGEPKDWRAELGMALAGPLASLGLGILCLVLAQAIAGPIAVDPEDPSRVLAQVGPVATLLLWLGPVNIILGLFNLVPGFPLDGGRVLRAILWGLTGDLTRSTLMAAMAGQVVSWMLIGLGFAMILGLRVPVFGSGPLGGFWLALIGWFLGNAARQGWQGRLMEDRLGNLPAARVMHRDFRMIAPDLSVLELVDQGFLALSYRAYPVVEDERLRGLVSLEDVRRLERRHWAELRAADVMTPLDRLQLIGPDDSAFEALRRLAEQGFNQLPVVVDGRLLGLVTREDILKWLALEGAGTNAP